MKAIILAAGSSNRLRPLTEKIPKTLLDLASNLKIIDSIIENCRQHNIRDFYVVTGHGHEKLKLHLEKYDLNFQLIYNAEYADKGNIYSYYLALQKIDDDFILINSDTIFHSDILKNLLEHEKSNVLAVDDVKTLGSEEMKIIHQNQEIKKIHKSLNPEQSHGEYIGIAKLSKKNKQDLIKATEEMLEEDDSLYYEDALQRAIDNNLLIHAVSTNGLPCMEIDTPEDLANAKKLISQICQ